MGIFSSIKQKATQLSDFMQINTEIHKLEAFYFHTERKLASTEVIEKPSQDVLNVLNKIRTYLTNYPLNKNDKYKNLSDKYYNVIIQTEQHNENVERILASIASFPEIYNNTLLNPTCYNPCDIYPYNKVYNEIKNNFSSHTSEVEVFLTQYDDLKFSIQEISRQYSVKDCAASLMDIGKNYIFAKEKNTLIEQLKSYLPRIGIKHFYQFPSVTQLNDKIDEQNLHYLEEITSNITPLYEKVLNDPYIQLNIKPILEYDSIVLDLESEYPNNSQSLSHLYHSITAHIDEIRTQYDNRPKANKLLDIKACGYISLQNTQKITDKLKSILPAENVYHYYDFPTVNNLEYTISIHNSDIINSAAYEFNDLYARILQKPTDYDISIINNYSLMVEENEHSNKYSSNAIRNFFEQYHIINSNLEEIKRQYTAVSKLNSLMNINNYSHINDKTAENMIEQVKKYLPAPGVAHYYSFPSINQFQAEIIKHNEAFFRANPNIVYSQQTNTLVTLTNAQLEIKAFLEKRNIKYLIHFTDSKNVESIKRHGILSVQQLMNRGIAFSRNDLGRYDNMPDYISLSITNPNEELLSSFRKKGSILDAKFIYIDASILYLETTDRRYCYTNAANRNCKSGNSLYYLKNMFSDTLTYQVPSTGIYRTFNRFEEKRRSNEPTDPQAEILFNRKIDPKYILDIK